ncbi:hypothetical protein VNO77_04032 [Canavalia gladiata]|uniref:Uncharacterized protein n=1 Tax=Canavalia gladiata TaxID=3824 RepID=A0AAN9R7E7_CANGL
MSQLGSRKLHDRLEIYTVNSYYRLEPYDPTPWTLPLLKFEWTWLDSFRPNQQDPPQTEGTEFMKWRGSHHNSEHAGRAIPCDISWAQAAYELSSTDYRSVPSPFPKTIDVLKVEMAAWDWSYTVHRA